MTEISLPFNSVDHDRVYDAEAIAKKDSYFIPDGVNAQGGALTATADGANMNVTIADGMAYIQGHFYNNTAPKILTHPTADPTYDRIDRIVARLDKNQGARQITIEIKQGTPAASPVEPPLQSDAYIVEVPIARVLITHAISTIAQAKITDERGTLLDPIQYWTQIATLTEQLATKADNLYVDNQDALKINSSDIVYSTVVGTLTNGATGSITAKKLRFLKLGFSIVSVSINLVSIQNAGNKGNIGSAYGADSGKYEAGIIGVPNTDGTPIRYVHVYSNGDVGIMNTWTSNNYTYYGTVTFIKSEAIS